MKKPIVITAGDPSGIGPEVIAKMVSEFAVDRPLAILADPNSLPPTLNATEISALEDISNAPANGCFVLPYHFPAEIVSGVPNPDNAKTIVRMIEDAAAFCMAGTAVGMVTAPINKLSLYDGASFAFPGHTEFLASLAGDCPVAMMLACSELRVVPMTIHIALSQVPDLITEKLILDACRLVHGAMATNFGLKNPTLAVAGLNPHAGEGGRMGREDDTIIAPALQKLRDEGIDVKGPYPPDTMFHAQARANYDVAMCMYHDQALIPIKTIDFAGGVNVTLGLPFVRTSPDHGTAYDIAGKGIADPTSMIAATKMAIEMADTRGH